MGRPKVPLTRPYLVTGPNKKTLWTTMATKMATEMVLAGLQEAGLVNRATASRMKPVIAASLKKYNMGLEPALETAFRRWCLSERQEKGRTNRPPELTDLQDRILKAGLARPAAIVANRLGCSAAYVRMVRKEKRNDQ